MSQTFQKARFFLLHPEVNGGKVERLEALHKEYVSYVRICVQAMIDGRRLNLARSEKQAFFPRAAKLTSQIEKNARDHAIQIVSTWAKSRYALKVKGLISKAKRAGEITESQAKRLYTVGKYLRDQPKGQITQEDIDLYWKILDERGGRKPYWGFYGREACIEEAKAVDRAWKALELRRPVSIRYPATW